MIHFEADYFCTLCSYIPKAGDTMYILYGKACCPKCGTRFPEFATNRFKSCSVDFTKVPNQNYPIRDYEPLTIRIMGDILCINCGNEFGMDEKECPYCREE